MRNLFPCLFLIAPALGAARADDLAWPLTYCSAAEIASASPAPPLSDAHSLIDVPFFAAFFTLTAGYVVGLDADNRPIIRCAVFDSDPWLVPLGAVAVAGLKFSTPRWPNKAAAEGRYIVRLYDTFGIGAVRRPPPAPLLPPCTADPVAITAGAAPKPISRVAPAYPEGAEIEGIEGEATIVVDVYASGATTPRCLKSASPAGWFEHAALTAISQWRFAPTEGLGDHIYIVTTKFRLE